jgi:hypothetical protein
MPIAVLVLTLVAFAWALIASPGFRPLGIVGGLVAAALLGLYLWRQAPSESERSAGRIGPDELVLDSLTLERTARGASLTGRITNGSGRYRLRDLTLSVRLRDCPEATTPPESCPVIGEARSVARPDVPPGQIRALTAHFVFSDLPPLGGTLAWDWRIIAIRATEQAQPGSGGGASG